MYQIQNWLDDQQIDDIQYSAYWNNEDLEKVKEWYILDGDFSKMERYLEKTNLASDLVRAQYVLNKKFKKSLSGVGIDIAASNLWAAPSLTAIENVFHLYCLEISRHRLFKLCPVVLNHYAVPDNKVTLALGSFYDIHLKDKSLDFCFMSSAFHHADDPNRLLKEVRRVLKPGGVVVIIGEHIIRLQRARVKYLIKFLGSRFLSPRFQEYIFGKHIDVRSPNLRVVDILRPDPVLGDHYYLEKEYYHMFSKNLFLAEGFKSKNPSFQSFLLIKR